MCILVALDVACGAGKGGGALGRGSVLGCSGVVQVRLRRE